MEPIPATGLTVIHRGVAARRGRVLLTNHCFGTDMILVMEALRDRMDAISLTFSQARNGRITAM